jgi:hypothetical protein
MQGARSVNEDRRSDQCDTARRAVAFGRSASRDLPKRKALSVNLSYPAEALTTETQRSQR